jgi:putative transposase
MAVLERLFTQYGYPTFIRSDNGPEFIANALSAWLSTQGVTTRYIEPGSPWQNAVDERVNGTVRDECLNMEMFHHVDHARALVRIFQRHYNQERPHSSLGYRTPQEIASKYGLKTTKNNSWKTNPLGSGTLGTKIFLPGYGTGITKLLKTIRSRK